MIGGGVKAVDQNKGQVDQSVPESYEALLDDSRVLVAAVLPMTATVAAALAA